MKIKKPVESLKKPLVPIQTNPVAHVFTPNSGASQKDNLIYVDDVAIDGSVKRTYFKNSEQMSQVLKRKLIMQDIIGEDRPSTNSVTADKRQVNKSYSKESSELSGLILERRGADKSSSQDKRSPLVPNKLNFDINTARGANSSSNIRDAMNEQRELNDPTVNTQENPGTGRVLHIDLEEFNIEYEPSVQENSTVPVQEKNNKKELRKSLNGLDNRPSPRILLTSAESSSFNPNNIAIKRFITRGTQTDPLESGSFICRNCHQQAEPGSHNKNQVSFGNSPHRGDPTSERQIMHSSKEKSGKEPGYLHLDLSLLENSAKGKTNPEKQIVASGGIKVYDQLVGKRALFRQKISSNSSSKGSTAKRNGLGEGSKQSPGKINQKSYINHFESKINYYENSDIKYFSVERRRNLSNSGTGRSSQSKQKSLNNFRPHHTLDNPSSFQEPDIPMDYLFSKKQYIYNDENLVKKPAIKIKELMQNSKGHDRSSSLHEASRNKHSRSRDNSISSRIDAIMKKELGASNTTAAPYSVKPGSRGGSIRSNSRVSREGSHQDIHVSKFCPTDEKQSQGLKVNVPITLNIDLQDIQFHEASNLNENSPSFILKAREEVIPGVLNNNRPRRLVY
jgi:hypothetical protein